MCVLSTTIFRPIIRDLTEQDRNEAIANVIAEFVLNCYGALNTHYLANMGLVWKNNQY